MNPKDHPYKDADASSLDDGACGPPAAPPSAGAPSVAIHLPETEPNTPGVLPDDTMSEAGRKVLHFHFLRMLRHEPGTRLGMDIEELHDMRVATRRMRSALRVFAPFFEPDVLRSLRKGLRRTGRALGRVRDLDVFMEKTERHLNGSSPAERLGLEPLLTEWQVRRETARNRMLTYLDGKRYRRFVVRFTQFLEADATAVRPRQPQSPTPVTVRLAARGLISSRLENVRSYDAALEAASLGTLHRLRIDCRRFRYALEFFREVLGPEAEMVIDEAVAIQDHLGALVDADVASRLLIEFLQQWSQQEHRRRTDIRGVAHYLVAKQDEERRLLDDFADAWTHFNRPEVEQFLSQSLAPL